MFGPFYSEIIIISSLFIYPVCLQYEKEKDFILYKNLCCLFRFIMEFVNIFIVHSKSNTKCLIIQILDHRELIVALFFLYSVVNHFN